MQLSALKVGVWAALLMAGAAGVALGQEASTAAAKEVPAKFQHVRLPGDFDHRDLVEQVAASLEAARAEGMGVVFDVGGNEGRTDVVNALCAALRETPVYTVVYLVDNADRRVGVGQLMVGLCADRVAMDSGTHVEGRGDEDRFREWVQDEPDWEVVVGELRDRVAKRLEGVTTSQTVAEEIAGALMNPPEGFAIARAGDRCTVVTAEATGALVLVNSPRNSLLYKHTGMVVVRIRADSRKLAPLGVVTAGSIKNTLAKTGGALEAGRRAVNIEETIGSLKLRLERLIADAETIERDVDERLDLPDPALKTVAKNTYLAAAQEGRHNLLNVSRMISEIEGMVERVPELLRTRVPGQVVAGAKPSSFASKWRTRIQRLQTKHDALLARVESFERIQ